MMFETSAVFSNVLTYSEVLNFSANKDEHS